MSALVNPTRVPWLRSDAPRPLCDVPWLGTSIVQSDGRVNFCCFSSAEVGNVNQTAFQEIWDGPTMRAIRQALAEQRLPPECRSSSCPISRGDDLHYLYDRMEGPSRFKWSGSHDPHRELRQRLSGSAVEANRRSVRIGDRLTLTARLCLQGDPLVADLFLCLQSPNGALLFLPSREDYPLPCRTSLRLEGQGRQAAIVLVDQRLDETAVIGGYEVCAALFAPDSNPNLLSNCYWAGGGTFTVKPMHPLVAWGRRMAGVRTGGSFSLRKEQGG